MLIDCDLLTENFWVPIDRLANKPIKVAQYNQGKIEFVYPTTWSIIQLDETHRWGRNGFGFSVGPTHNIISFCQKGLLQKPSHSFKPRGYFKTGGKLSGTVHELSLQEKLLVGYHVMGEPVTLGRIRSLAIKRIKFRYHDKILALVKKLKYDYVIDEGIIVCVPETSHFGKLSSWVSLKNKSCDWCLEVLKELLAYKVKLDEYDLVETLASMADSVIKHGKLVYDEITIYNLKQKVFRFEAVGYDIKVPSNMLICRTDKIFITGT